MIRRREVLAAVGTTLSISAAGCAQVRCHVDGNYDYLRVERENSEELPQPENRIEVRFTELSGEEQEVVQEAINSGERVRRCHDFQGDGSPIERLADRIRQLKRENDGDVFILKDSTHYGIRIVLLDVVVI